MVNDGMGSRGVGVGPRGSVGELAYSQTISPFSSPSFSSLPSFLPTLLPVLHVRVGTVRFIGM